MPSQNLHHHPLLQKLSEVLIYTKCIEISMEFEWDENKNRQNQQKHGISFEERIKYYEYLAQTT